MLAAAAGCFAAGTAVGLLIPRFAEAEAMPSSSARAREQDEKLVRDLVADLGLSGTQERSLRLILQDQREQEDQVIDRLLTTEANDLPLATKNRLLWLRNRTTQRILVVLDPQQRARYERETKPGPNVGPEHGGATTATNR
jgi:hypothetical protein